MKLDTMALIGAATFATAMAFTALTTEAQANQNCADHAQVVERLADRYGETLVGVGMTAQGHAIETFVNVECGSWSIVITSPGGPACLVASGQSWSIIDPAPVVNGEPL